MLESGSSGSVRGLLSNEHPYREPGSKPEIAPPEQHVRSALRSRHRVDAAACPFGAKLRHCPWRGRRSFIVKIPGPISISGNIGSIPDAIFRLMSGPHNDRGANNNGRANAACGSPRLHPWQHLRLHRGGRPRHLR